MGSGSRGSGGESRARVHWSPRGRRRWCPGAARASVAACAQATTGWTSYLHWQSVLEALRGRRASAPGTTPAELPSEPRGALPDRRRRTPSEEPAVDGWLDGTPE